MPRYHRNDSETLHDEQLALQFLCTNPAEPAAQKLKSRLSVYNWRSTDHSVVYEALNHLRSASTAAQLREQLPAQLTRMGFPDVNYEIFFEGKIPEENELQALLKTLLHQEDSSRK